eukprot:6039000-Amphidinium_carterae.1
MSQVVFLREATIEGKPRSHPRCSINDYFASELAHAVSYQVAADQTSSVGTFRFSPYLHAGRWQTSLSHRFHQPSGDENGDGDGASGGD